MKAILLIFVFAILAISIGATSFTVDNNISPTGQYTSWISAYNAAADGDTIYIYPSPYEYGPAWNEGGLGKRLTVIGGGFNPANPDLYTSKINLYVNSPGGIGSVLSGIETTGNVTSSYQVTYTNCLFNNPVNLQAAGSQLRYCWCKSNVTASDGVHINACTIEGSLIPASQSDVSCSNSVFVGNVNHVSTAGNSNLCVYLINCLFANSGDGSHTLHSGWGGPVDLHFLNCIMEEITINNPYTFEYYMFEGSSAYITDPSNMQFVDLDLVLVDINGGDYHLVPSSPAIGAGHNGVDIGIYGGGTPFNDLWHLTRLPSITAFSCPGIVDQNGYLNVHIEASAGN